MGKTRIDIELVYAIQTIRNYINGLNLDEIEWFKNSRPLELPEETIKEGAFTGFK